MIKSVNGTVIAMGKEIELLRDMENIAPAFVKSYIEDGLTQKEAENLVRATCEAGIQVALIKNESDFDALTKEILEKIARGMN